MYLVFLKVSLDLIHLIAIPKKEVCTGILVRECINYNLIDSYLSEFLPAVRHSSFNLFLS